MKKIVTFGELLLRFSKPGQLRLTQGDLFTSKYGGSEANVAVSLATQGEDVTYIGKCAFADCQNINTVTCLAKNVPTAAESVFETRFWDYSNPNKILQNATLYVPASALNAYKSADTWKSFGTILPISSYPATSVQLNKTTASLREGEQLQLLDLPGGREAAAQDRRGAVNNAIADRV